MQDCFTKWIELRPLKKATGKVVTPYTPQCNTVERANRVIKAMMAQNVTKNQKTWDKYLLELAFAYNMAQHESTGHTPAYLNFGMELKSPGSVAQQTALPQRDEHHKRIHKLREALDLAKIKIAQFSKTAKILQP